MKKILMMVFGIFVSLSLSLSLSLSIVTPAFATAPDWNVKGIYTIVFTCVSGCGGSYPHTMNVTSMNMTSGAFSGTGLYNTAPAYTWNVTGSVDGSNLAFTIVYTGLNPGYTINASGTIAPDGTPSGTASGLGQTFSWVSTTGKADMQPVGVITSPAIDADVMGTLNLTATYTDDNPAGVQWAVREGTCAAATNTRAGNVDGFSSTPTPFSWTGTIPNMVFSATIDVSAWTSGVYCFVFNPGESSLERDVRLTNLFDIIRDVDKDGVGDLIDNCSAVANPDQANLDGDSLGDVCDPDDDGDGIEDQADCNPLINDGVTVAPDSKACQLYKSGVEGKGILNAPGLQKPFNPKSQATENAGKKN